MTNTQIDEKTEAGQALQTPTAPLGATTPPPNQTANPRFRVYAALSLEAAAEVVVEASHPQEADHLAQTVLQGRPFAQQLHRILERHTLTVPTESNRQVVVQVESVLLDFPPEATVWQMAGLGP